MESRFKVLHLFLVILILALPAAACKPWESAMTLIMTVETPQEGTSVNTSPVTVTGTVNKTAAVKVNEAEVPIKGGKFSAIIPLTEGDNVIRIVATSGKETQNKNVTIVFNRSQP